MAFNPSPEVAVARDAARKLNAPVCVVLYLTRDGKRLATASFGETRALCGEGKTLADVAFDAVMRHYGG